MKILPSLMLGIMVICASVRAQQNPLVQGGVTLSAVPMLNQTWYEIVPAAQTTFVVNAFGQAIVNPDNDFEVPTGVFANIPLPIPLPTQFVFTGFNNFVVPGITQMVEMRLKEFIVRLGKDSIEQRGCRVGGTQPATDGAFQTTVGIAFGDPLGGSVDWIGDNNQIPGKEGWRDSRFSYNHDAGGPATSINIIMVSTDPQRIKNGPCIFDLFILPDFQIPAPIQTLTVASAPGAPAPAAAPAVRGVPSPRGLPLVIAPGVKLNPVKIGPKIKK
jgi:hypothetical protein